MLVFLDPSPSVFSCCVRVCVCASAGIPGVRSSVSRGSVRDPEGGGGRLRGAGEQHLLRAEAQARLQTAGPARPGQRTCGWRSFTVTHGDTLCVCVCVCDSSIKRRVAVKALSPRRGINSLTSYLLVSVSHSSSPFLRPPPPPPPRRRHLGELESGTRR